MKTQTKKRKGSTPKKRLSEPDRFTQKNSVNIIAKVHDLAVSLCNAEGIELVHIEYQRESCGRVMRVYIDKPGGVSLGDCSNISRQLSDLLDVYINSDEAYSLEVSSPGTDRPLGNKVDFQRFKGNLAKIRTHIAVEG